MFTKKWAVDLVILSLLALEGSLCAQDEAPTVMLKGRVLEEDGTSVEQRIRVELVCDNRVIEQTFPDTKGYFVFEVGARNVPSDHSDASAPGSYRAGGPPTPQFRGGFGTMQSLSVFGVNLNGCEIRVPSRDGNAESIKLGVRSPFDDPDVGVIILQRSGGKSGTIVRQTTEAVPREAKEAFRKAQEEWGKQKVDHSVVKTELEKAVEIAPEFAAAWHLLGQARLASDDRQGAREAFQRSIQSEGGFVQAYVDLARLEFQDRRWEEVSKLTDQLSNLNPEMPEAYFFGGLAKFYSNRIDDAEKSLRWLDSQGLSAQYPLTYFYLGLIDSDKGDIQQAARELRLYLKSVPEARVPDDWKKRIVGQLAEWEAQGLIPKER